MPGQHSCLAIVARLCGPGRTRWMWYRCTYQSLENAPHLLFDLRHGSLFAQYTMDNQVWGAASAYQRLSSLYAIQQPEKWSTNVLGLDGRPCRWLADDMSEIGAEPQSAHGRKVRCAAITTLSVCVRIAPGFSDERLTRQTLLGHLYGLSNTVSVSPPARQLRSALATNYEDSPACPLCNFVVKGGTIPLTRLIKCVCCFPTILRGARASVWILAGVNVCSSTVNSCTLSRLSIF